MEAVLLALFSGGGAVLLGVAGSRAWSHFRYRYSDSEQAVIRIERPSSLSPDSGDFGLRFIRDGKDEMKDRRPLVNRDYPFSPEGTSLVVRFRYSKALGCQFKPYFQCRKGSPQEIQEALEKAGWTAISPDENEPLRLWFLWPDQPRYTTRDGFVNHYLYAGERDG